MSLIDASPLISATPVTETIADVVVAVAIGDAAYRRRCHLAAVVVAEGVGVNAEHGEELLQGTLRLALIIVCVLPAFRERRRRLTYFIQRFQFEDSSVRQS